MHLSVFPPAALIGDPTRAALLIALIGGRAQPASALAYAASVSPQVASNQLAQLVRGGLLTVEQEGRHRYYRLASAQVAVALESLSSLRPNVRRPQQPADQRLCFARSCYDHLAGRLGVAVVDALLAQGYLLAPTALPKVFEVTDEGRRWFAEFGIALDAHRPSRRPLARRCLDWTERRHHLAGFLGERMLLRLQARRWLQANPSDRVLRLTQAGQRGLRDSLGLSLP